VEEIAPQSPNPTKRGVTHLEFDRNLSLNKEAPQQPGRGEGIGQRHNPLRLTERHFPSQNNQSAGRKRSRCVRVVIRWVPEKMSYTSAKNVQLLCV